ncbi:ATP-binding cassette sub-family C member 4-like [Sitodiplosis mosellana]|uniref:ATP-binding cassette sub-family C member 4-like n=1 Tax=Sitodiplosis mosellana TaxID=263140 RepID=UPI0024444562|nr:ATP-binding cassette sub-family C member 4-like [Sitodiplosis mosellana]
MESNHCKLPPNPRESANILSIVFFTWTLPLFKKGYEKILKLGDIFQPLTSDKSDKLGDRLETNWNKQTSKPRHRSLLTVIFVTFWRDYAFLAFLCFFNDIILRLGQRFLLGYLLQYFRAHPTITYDEAIYYAVGILTLNALNAILSNHIMFISFHYGLKVRVAVCSLIYRKSLRLSQTALGETAPGKVANLLSNDVNRFDQFSYFLNSLWISPLLTVIVGCLLWHEVGVAGIFGIAVVLTIVPILSYAGKLTSKYRLQTALQTDERLRFMDEIISGVQVIKIYAWEKPFAKLITFARQMELKALRKTYYIRGFHMVFILFTTRMALFCTMLTIILLYGTDHITAAKIFVITSYFGVIAHMMSQRFTRGITECAEVMVALERLETFMYLDEKKTEANDDKKTQKNGVKNLSRNGENRTKMRTKCALQTELPNDKVSISMRNVTATWVLPNLDDLSCKSKEKKGINQNKVTTNNNVHHCGGADAHLSDLNFDFPKARLIGVIGPVGAGKSSLLQAILRELPLQAGSINVNGSISYASQEPWVFAASVRQNILFGEEYDREHYNAVIRTCALEKDFEQFENGDLTIVGERGASLSGGQKARINLARACYRNADIYLFDDPLSAVDAHVGTHIFDKCIGPKSRLAKQSATRVLVTHQVYFLKEADWIILLKDGKIEAQGTPVDLAHNGVDFAELEEIVEQLEGAENVRKISQQMSRKSSTQSAYSVNSRTDKSESEDEEDGNSDEDVGILMEATSKGAVKGSISWNYFKTGAHWSIIISLFFSFFLVQFIASAIDYWVSVWTKQEEARTYQKTHAQTKFYGSEHSVSFSTNFCIIVQGSLISALLILGIARSYGFYAICVRISQKLHDAMFKGIISTTMRFFDTNPSGRILNRFAKDIGAIDEHLPKSILDATQNMLSMFGLIIVTTVVNPYFLIPVLILSILFIYIQQVYLKTSKNVKRLEGITKSPAFTHLAATLSGLSTVRAYNAEKILTNEFDGHQDTHSACWYIYLATRSAFSLSLDLICFVFVSCIILYYMLFDTGVSGEKIGLAVTQALNLTGVVQWGVRECAEVSTQMMAVERVLEYCGLEPEKQPSKPVTVSIDWPSKGCIEFRNVFYRYCGESEPVLQGLSFVIKPMEKIGIVGRTGAGKSSFIESLFRLACVDGEILIDGVDTVNVPLSDLRKNIAIIPQDPVLFSGTLRRNLDPFEEYSDADIWSALESVELKSAVSDEFGLESKVLPHGANYSVGQRQLLCLARAILRKNRILVLDEATANVDPHTDLLIQQTIREKFTECTVLTVAHRLHTIIDSDRVMVMDSGRPVEFDNPYNLLQNKNGMFYGMVKALGEHDFNRLTQIAGDKAKSQ